MKCWIKKTDLDEGTLKQVNNILNLPFYDNYGALMPDAHSGYGVPIGSVLAFKDIVIPYAVGSDIGCGMHLINTGIEYSKFTKDVREEIKDLAIKMIPNGHNHRGDFIHLCKNNIRYQSEILNKLLNTFHIQHDKYKDVITQIGTLGGGNHFIELQCCHETGFAYIMIHSGSRNIGNKVCDKYDDIARDFNRAYYSKVPDEYSLAFLPKKDPMQYNYIKEMYECLEFAKLNRKFMGLIMIDIICKVLNLDYDEKYETYDVHHNYAKPIKIHNINYILHRKGATSAELGEYCIIPGSCGSASYLCKGLGCAASMNSCSHGAGRSMSRTKAIENLNYEDELKKLNDLGIIHCMSKQDDLAESVSSYKDISTVMQNQNNLVSIVHEFLPMLSIKSSETKKKYTKEKEIE